MPKNRSNSRNSRNSLITQVESLTSLLLSACDTLDRYYPELMSSRLEEWWTPRKREFRERFRKRSEAGIEKQAIHQIVTMEEELEDDCCIKKR